MGASSFSVVVARAGGDVGTFLRSLSLPYPHSMLRNPGDLPETSLPMA